MHVRQTKANMQSQSKQFQSQAVSIKSDKAPKIVQTKKFFKQ